MWYAIIGHDRPGTLELRKASRTAHLERLQSLKLDGKLLLAGPFPAIDSEDPGAAGFEFDSLVAARAWADADPYLAAGVYERVDVRPFRKVLP